MAEQSEPKLGWVARRRERKRLRAERAGDSPEKAAERHVPRGDVIDVMLKAGGVERESRFKQ